MASKTLTISEDAYVRLRRHKGPKESFSDVINRLAGRPDLLGFAGTISDGFSKELTQAVGDARSRLDRDARRRIA